MPGTATIATDCKDAARADRCLLIGGNLVETDRTFPSLNPATGEVLGYAPDATVADAEAAVAAAREAFDTMDWSTSAEVGATASLCQGAQLDQPIAIERYYADLFKTYSMREGDLGNIESRGMQHYRCVEKKAEGVVAAIMGRPPS